MREKFVINRQGKIYNMTQAQIKKPGSQITGLEVIFMEL